MLLKVESRHAFYSWHSQVTKVCSKPFEVLFSFSVRVCVWVCLPLPCMLFAELLLLLLLHWCAQNRRPIHTCTHAHNQNHPLPVTIIRLDPTITFPKAIPIKMCSVFLTVDSRLSKSLPCMGPKTTKTTRIHRRWRWRNEDKRNLYLHY